MNQNLSKKISIIVPAYNVEKYIAQCIESLINQTYKNIEILIVNDGSKDNTLNIINDFAQKDSRIKVINQENQGVSTARNNALKNISSDFVMFVDSDDWLDITTCEETLKIALEENADVVMFGYVREYEKNSLPKAAFEDEKLVFNKEEVLNKLHRRIFGPIREELSNPEKLNVHTPVCMKLYKTKIIKGLQFIPITELGICEDGYFNINVFEKAKKVVFIKSYFYHYRKVIANGSLTQQKDNDIFCKTKKFYFRLKQMINDEKLSEEYDEAIKNRLVLSLIENVITIVNANNNISEKIKKILNDETFEEACKELYMKYLPIHWTIFFFLAKIKFTFGVCVLSKIIVKLIDKK